MKTKEMSAQGGKTKFQIFTYWASVSAIGIVVGVSLQFAKAWTEPGAAAPGGNVGAPINVGGVSQTKSGLLSLEGGLRVGEAGNAYSYLTLSDDESSNGVKYIHANSNVVGFLGGDGNWLSYWDSAGSQRLTGSQIYMANSGNNFYGDGANLAARQSGDFYVQSANGSGYRNIYAGDVYLNSVGKWASAVGGSPVPAGAVMAFSLASCPSGWIPANGLSGTPDLRGEFVRGLSNGRAGVDTGRTLGSSQGEAIQSHTHPENIPIDAGGSADLQSLMGSANSDEGITNYQSLRTGATGGPETRPRNVALLYCVKS